MGMGVRTSTVSVEITQGSLSPTGGDLDLAIEGRGYFEITLPSGDAAYTRDGKFYRNAEGLVVNADGYELADNITVPNETRRLTIALDGLLSESQAQKALAKCAKVILKTLALMLSKKYRN